MEHLTIGKASLEIIRGDITKQSDIEAIVNAANAHLRIGGGVAGAIHTAAGHKLEKESSQLSPISPGQAVITGAYNLPNKYVIHCLGPVYGRDVPHDKLLSDCYDNALKICEDEQIESIAFPAISTGAFGYPVKEAAEIALNTITSKMITLKHLKLIRMVLFSNEDFYMHKETMKTLAKE